MGQKVHPIGMRLGYIQKWNSTWYSNSKNYALNLINDIQVRNFLFNYLKDAYISHIAIERPAKNAKIIIHTARPGIIIGKKGDDIEKLRLLIKNIVKVPVQISIEEIKKVDLDAKLVADSIVRKLEKRMMFRRIIKTAIFNVMKAGAKGVKVSISGRLSGADIARTEWSKEGRIPLHTFRANIDYCKSQALTTYGILGVKVWIFKNEIMKYDGKDNKSLFNRSV